MSSSQPIKPKSSQPGNVVPLRGMTPGQAAYTKPGAAGKPIDTFRSQTNSEYSQLVGGTAKVSNLVPVDVAHDTLQADMNAMALSEVFGDLGSEFDLDAKDLEFLQQLDQKGFF